MPALALRSMPPSPHSISQATIPHNIILIGKLIANSRTELCTCGFGHARGRPVRYQVDRTPGVSGRMSN